MPKLLACPHCQFHALSSESRCPHCRAQLRPANGRLALTAAAALLGLSPVACEKAGPEPAPPSDSGGVAEPEYGVPDTGEAPSDPDAQNPDAPADPDGDPAFEAEYGVPEPDYGVPEIATQD
ncbi:MAG: hypothetical protein ACRBN8_37710 [Nannocystales bacterium]